MNEDASRFISVALGEGTYCRAISQVFGAFSIPDDWLKGRHWPLHGPTSIPLVASKRVLQIVSSNESSARTQWRHDRFWELYGELGGKREAIAPGLKWLLIDCRAEKKDDEPLPSSFCARVHADEGLQVILAALGNADSHRFSEWHNARVDDREWSLRVKICRLVRDGEATAGNRDEAVRLARGISPLNWERFCPPPGEHALANQIRAWLLCPETIRVTPWFAKGRELLPQTNLYL